jgi:hypothetical protein
MGKIGKTHSPGMLRPITDKVQTGGLGLPFALGNLSHLRLEKWLPATLAKSGKNSFDRKMILHHFPDPSRQSRGY